MPVIQQRRLLTSPLASVTGVPAAASVGSQLLPETWLMRFGSVPDVSEQWKSSPSVKASARANWNGSSARV